jgi:hypothetical protein
MIYTDLGTKVQKALTDTFVRAGYVNPLVIFKHQNAPEPTRTYCAIYIINIEEQGRSTKSLFLQDVEDISVGRHYAQQHFKATLQVTFMGEDSGDMAYDLQVALHNSLSTNEDFLKEDLSFIDCTNVRSNPQLRETRWVDSFNFDINLGYSVQHTEDVNWVEYVTINGIQYPSP